MTLAPDSVPLLSSLGDTIAALATPLGRGALALLRLSGTDAFGVASRVVRPWRPTPRVATVVSLHDPTTGRLVDRSIVTLYVAPRSYTGEDLVELSVHGGTVVPTLALSALFAAGARQATPGEFTRRAVINGKINVLQAEATADLIDARTRAMHEAALAQLHGGLSRRVETLRSSLLALEALLAYEVDFPEEDSGPVPPERVEAAAADLLSSLDSLLATAHAGEIIRAGAAVVLAGPPNVGKSSLFNALVGVARAIVTDVPGTTRDALEALVEVGRWPVRLVDTAGLRDAGDVVEKLGVEVSERWLRSADVVLACGDTPGALTAALDRVTSLTHAAVVPVRTKIDLVTSSHQFGPATSFAAGPVGPTHISALVAYSDQSPSVVAPVVGVSALSGVGLGELTQLLDRILAERYGGSAVDAPLLTRERHRRAVAQARDEVTRFIDLWRAQSLPTPVAAVHLRAATGALEDLIGTVNVEDVLEHVFSSFCVGK